MPDDKVTVTLDMEVARAVQWTLAMRAGKLRMELADETALPSSKTVMRRQMAAQLEDAVRALDRAIDAVAVPR
jgi:hypothetical protein